MNNYNIAILWIGAYRYYCGRMTSATHDFIEILLENWHRLPKRAQDIIKRDLEREFESDNNSRWYGDDHHPLGTDYERQKWGQVLAQMEKQ